MFDLNANSVCRGVKVAYTSTSKLISCLKFKLPFYPFPKIFG
jgi:hypothetical protein